MKLSITPTKGRVLIKPLEEVYRGNLIIPDSAEKDKPQEGVVMSLSEGALNKKGKLIPFEFEVGDHVVYQRYSGTTIQQNGVALQLVEAKNIFAIIQ